MKSSRKTYFFNLVELVCIITALLCLLAMILPAAINSLGSGKITACQANLTEVHKKLNAYLEANDFIMPVYSTGWVKALDGAVNQDGNAAGSWACPSQDPNVSYIADLNAQQVWRGSHFGINQHIASSVTSAEGESIGHWAQANIQDIREPSRKVGLGDTPGGNYYQFKDPKTNKTLVLDPTIAGMSLGGIDYTDGYGPNPSIPLPFLRHAKGTVNFSFMDGRVENMSSYPMYSRGQGTAGYTFWSAEHVYPGMYLPKPKPKPAEKMKPVEQPGGGDNGTTPPATDTPGQPTNP